MSWLCCVCMLLVASAPFNGTNRDAVQEVLSGQRTEASAAWWGFDPSDATECLQAAIDSGARTVVVPYMGTEWIVRPIRLRSNLEIEFEPGVVLLAKKDEFRGKGDSLLRATDAADVVVRGYGATLRMRKADYQHAPYEKAEWRTALSLTGCRRVRVEGIRLESSGGDGIYIGCTGTLPRCEDVIIRDVVCDDHHRQGISVISAANLVIENCLLANTGGTAPQAGIDFEPNSENEQLRNCVLRNCGIEGNRGAGILVYLKNLSRQSEPISLAIENCYIRSGQDTGIGVGAIADNGPTGAIEFKNCTIEDTDKGGVYVYDKSPDGARVRFENCKWRDAGTEGVGKRRAPLLLAQRRPALASKLGGIEFDNCYLYDSIKRPALEIEVKDHAAAVNAIQGRIFVHNPHGARIELPKNTANIRLEVQVIQDGPGSVP